MKLQKSTSNWQLVLGLISLKYTSNNFPVKENLNEYFYMHNFLRQTQHKSCCMNVKWTFFQFHSFHS